MEKAAISSYKALVARYGTPISDKLFHELRDYAMKRGIKLSGFKDFVGDIQTIKIVIDDICQIAEDFPRILDEKVGIWLELDYNLGTDFATTEAGHIIHLNGGYFSNIEVLEEEYDSAIAEGRFVSDTNWRSISRHEVGHVVAYAYSIDPLEVAKEIMKTGSSVQVRYRIGKELSLYAAEYEDGREFISESFSGYYSGTDNAIATEFVKRCLEKMNERQVNRMKSYSEAMYWRTNEKWFVINIEKDRFELTKAAPPRAIESFRMYLRQNDLPDNPIPINGSVK